MSKGIDLENNRFLILQGEVEQISLMKPKGQTENDEGLLEFLEDIIGTRGYVEKIGECEKCACCARSGIIGPNGFAA